MKEKNILDKSKINNRNKIIIGGLVGVVLIAITVFCVWNFNRKYKVTFENNGKAVEVLYVKNNKTILKENIKDKDDLGSLFIGWYEIIGQKDGNDILSEKPFDFNTKISKNIELKAVYNEEVEKITINFDSRDGSKVDSLTIEKGSSLVLPKNPTKKGYTFGNWETEAEIPITDGANLSESMTLYAVWKKNSTASKTYYCENGYTLNGTKCNKTETIQGTLLKETCSENYKKNGDVCVADAVSGYATESCPENYTRRPGYSYCYSNVQHVADAGTCTNNYSGGKYTNGYCYYGTVKDVEYSCSKGYKMIINHSASYDKTHECHLEAAIIKEYSCPNGYSLTNGSQCSKVTTKDALVK